MEELRWWDLVWSKKRQTWEPDFTHPCKWLHWNLCVSEGYSESREQARARTGAKADTNHAEKCGEGSASCALHPIKSSVPPACPLFCYGLCPPDQEAQIQSQSTQQNQPQHSFCLWLWPCSLIFLAAYAEKTTFVCVELVQKGFDLLLGSLKLWLLYYKWCYNLKKEGGKQSSNRTNKVSALYPTEYHKASPPLQATRLNQHVVNSPKFPPAVVIPDNEDNI